MGAIRKVRTALLQEDAGDDCEVFAFYPDLPVDDDDEWDSWAPEHDALAHTVEPEDTWPDWWCDCGTHVEGQRLNCTYCGEWREDIDALS